MSNAATGRVAAIIPAAGTGMRLGAEKPKAFIELDGISLLTRSALAMSVVADRTVFLHRLVRADERPRSEEHTSELQSH